MKYLAPGCVYTPVSSRTVNLYLGLPDTADVVPGKVFEVWALQLIVQASRLVENPVIQLGQKVIDIVIILAIITLVLALGFITGMFEKITGTFEEFPILQIDPTAGNPVSFMPAVISRGKQNKMTIGFYNNEDADIANSLEPSITCKDLSEVNLVAAGIAARPVTIAIIADLPLAVLLRTPTRMIASRGMK